MTVSMEKVHELAFRVVGDMGGAFTMGMGYLGDLVHFTVFVYSMASVERRSGPVSRVGQQMVVNTIHTRSASRALS